VDPHPDEPRLHPNRQVDAGTRVEVRTRFDRRWSAGFEVDAVIAQSEPESGAGGLRYRIRRRSDDSILPTEFGADEVRSEKKGRSMWWI
jgi:hypothetical protein